MLYYWNALKKQMWLMWLETVSSAMARAIILCALISAMKA